MTEHLETSIENTSFDVTECNNTISQEQNQKIIKKRKVVIKKTETTSEIDENILQKLSSYVEPMYPITKEKEKMLNQL